MHNAAYPSLRLPGIHGPPAMGETHHSGLLLWRLGSSRLGARAGSASGGRRDSWRKQ